MSCFPQCLPPGRGDFPAPRISVPRTPRPTLSTTLLASPALTSPLNTSPLMSCAAISATVRRPLARQGRGRGPDRSGLALRQYLVASRRRSGHRTSLPSRPPRSTSRPPLIAQSRPALPGRSRGRWRQQPNKAAASQPNARRALPNHRRPRTWCSQTRTAANGAAGCQVGGAG